MPVGTLQAACGWVRRRRRRRRIVKVMVEQAGRGGEVAARLALVAIRRVTARLTTAALSQPAQLCMRVVAPTGVARLAVSLAFGHVGRIPSNLAAVVAREQLVRRRSAPVAAVARSGAVCVALGHSGGFGTGRSSAFTPVVRQITEARNIASLMLSGQQSEHATTQGNPEWGLTADVDPKPIKYLVANYERNSVHAPCLDPTHKNAIFLQQAVHYSLPQLLCRLAT